MRRSRRFRRIFRKVNIFAVVFVAFVNACFFSPIHSLAADSVNSFFSQCCSVSNSKYNIYDAATSTDKTVNYRVANAFVAMQPNVAPEISQSFCSASFSMPFLFYFDTSAVDLSDCTVSGRVRLSLLINWNTIAQTSSKDQYLSINGVRLDSSEGVSVSFLSYAYENTDYSVGAVVQIDLSFDDFYIPYSSYSFNLYIDCTCLQYDATSTEYIYHSFNISPYPTEHYISTDDTSAIAGYLPDVNIDHITDGYDSTSGDQVASDFESGAASYDQAEDNLFNSADSALTGFKFFDFSTFGTITTGLSFVSGIMTSIYNNFGAMQGLGIVLSVLFSVMFMAIVIGFYRYFK